MASGLFNQTPYQVPQGAKLTDFQSLWLLSKLGDIAKVTPWPKVRRSGSNEGKSAAGTLLYQKRLVKPK